MSRENQVSDQILWQSLSLSERIDVARSVARDSSDLKKFSPALNEWCERGSLGDSELFSRRLESIGITTTVAKLAALETPPAPIPHHVRRRLDILNGALCARAPVSWRRQPKNRELLPFTELIFALAEPQSEALIQFLHKNIPESRRIFSGKFFSSCLDYLVQRLTTLLAPALFAEFDASRPIGRSKLALMIPGACDGSTSLYREFVESLHQSGWKPFLDSYPVLYRLVPLTIRQWKRFVICLVRRTVRDRDLLTKMLAFDGGFRSVQDLQLGISDPHRGGQCVALLTFTNGFRVAYKPRPLAGEILYNRLVLNLQCLGKSEIRVRPLPVLDRGEYGWVGFLKNCPSPAANQVAKSYGYLLGVSTLLGLGDLHLENVVIGESFVSPIDCECSQVGDELLEQFSSDRVSQRFGFLVNSLMRTGLLPAWFYDPDAGEWKDVGGSAALRYGSNPIEDSSTRWQNINTDSMSISARRVITRERHRDRSTLPLSNADDVIEGFHEFCIQLRSANKSTVREIVKTVEPNALRILLRDTRVYGAKLEFAVLPKSLQSGWTRSMLFEELGSSLSAAWGAEVGTYLIGEEIRALEANDVPSFTLAGIRSAIGLQNCGNSNSNVLTNSIGNRLQEIQDPRKIQTAHSVIGTALAGPTQALASQVAATFSSRLSGAADGIDRNDMTVGLRECARIVLGQRISRSNLSWINFSDGGAGKGILLGPASDDLYDGLSGICLFLASVYVATQDEKFRSKAVRLAIDICEIEESRGRSERLYRNRKLGSGASIGIWSVIYALNFIGRICDSPLLIERMQHLIVMQKGELPIGKNIDFLEGQAGVVACVAACLVEFPDSGCDELYEYIETWLTKSLNGFKQRESELLGLAHGNLGILMSMTKACFFCNDSTKSTVLRLVEECVDDASRGDEKIPRFVRGDGWCRGKSGIVQVGISGLKLKPTNIELANLLRNLANQIEETTRHTVSERADLSLCCGESGVIDTLILAGTHLNSQSLVEHAGERLVRLLNAVRSPMLADSESGRCDGNSLFKGVPGIGYTLARSLSPILIPCVLNWE